MQSPNDLDMFHYPAVPVLLAFFGWLSPYIPLIIQGVMNHRLMKLNYCLARHLMSRLWVPGPLHDTHVTRDMSLSQTLHDSGE